MPRTIKKATKKTVVSDPINKEIKVALKALNSLIKELQRKEKEKVKDAEFYRKRGYAKSLLNSAIEFAEIKGGIAALSSLENKIKKGPK